MLQKWLVWLGLCAAIAGCGGGSDSLETSSKDSNEDQSIRIDYGTPAPEANIQAFAKRLGAHFGKGEQSLIDSPDADPLKGIYSSSGDQQRSLVIEPQNVSTYIGTHRFFNTLTGVHFFTASDNERQQIQRTLPHFVYEGTAFRVLAGPANYAVPVYRFYNKITGTHLYTASEAERLRVTRDLSDVFNYEGIAWYGRASSYPGWQPLYRFFNRNTGTHFYTASEEERSRISSSLPQFSLEGIAYWISGSGVVDPSTWQPPMGTTPSNGNFVYLESQPGDFVGRGAQYLWTASNSRIQQTTIGSSIVDLSGVGYSSFRSFLYFDGPVADLRTGYQPGAVRTGLATATSRPGLDFSINSRGCNEVSGWIYVDQVSHDPDGTLASLEFRFEQLCQLSTGAMRGKVRWSKYDSLMPSGPVTPPPLNLWQPPAGTVPEEGSYIYFEGEKTRYVTDLSGSTIAVPHSYSRLLRHIDSVSGELQLRGTGNNFSALIQETLDNETLLFSFSGMWFLPRLTPGYYGNITKSPHPNPAFGAINLLYNKYSTPQEAWGCGSAIWSEGWFAIDEISYTDNSINSISLRFEKRCLGSNTRQRGIIRLAPNN